MTDNKPKNKITIPQRAPSKKTPQGIFDNLRPLPHPMEEILGLMPETQALPETGRHIESGSHPGIVSPPETGSLPNIADQAVIDQIADQRDLRDQALSPTKTGSLPETGAQAIQKGSLPEIVSHPIIGSLPATGSPEKANLLAGIQQVKGHLKLPNTILDSLLRQLDLAEQAVYLQLYRLSWGFGKDTCMIGLPQLSDRTNTSHNTAHNAVKKLVSRGLVEKLEWKLGKGKEQGTVYRLPIPGSLLEISSLPKIGSHPDSDPNKEDPKKKISKSDLLKLIHQYRQLQTGGSGSFAEQAEYCKRACARDGMIFDVDLYNRLAG